MVKWHVLGQTKKGLSAPFAGLMLGSKVLHLVHKKLRGRFLGFQNKSERTQIIRAED